ncbi:hypothetical protein EXN22_13900 [Pseudomonas tructae]|uniref:Uncharacterized protein n=1 Tax=Pseudomonas tructae TaxID=2518644 RepID=A0A411MIP0_9PSED|nr:hypothetical protein [Pseudomonas tructae]QBF26736.1 hypothetical protein EXN22_13900 [Pseudomonas tructae]
MPREDMSIDQKLVRFRSQALHQIGAEPWTSPAIQAKVLRTLLERVRAASDADLCPVVCVDLDLTSLLAPEKSREVLLQLAPVASELPMPAAQRALFTAHLGEIWRGKEQALLPGYTSTSIMAYGAYMLAQLQLRTGNTLESQTCALCEKWVCSKVHALLRAGYWDRDLAHDQISPGFTAFADRVAKAGGSIVFLSNRDASLREVSLACIRRLLGGAEQPFAFFGPGGASFDASSKASAVFQIEAGVCFGVHYGVAQNGQTIYPDAQDTSTVRGQQAIVAVIDDRAQNRRQIIEAAVASSDRLVDAGLAGIMDIASAAYGFCPEIDVVSMETVISSFQIQEAY